MEVLPLVDAVDPLVVDPRRLSQCTQFCRVGHQEMLSLPNKNKKFRLEHILENPLILWLTQKRRYNDPEGLIRGTSVWGTKHQNSQLH